MADWNEAFNVKRWSVLMGLQTAGDFNTVAGSLRSVRCEMPQVKPSANQYLVEESKGQLAEASAPHPGRVPWDVALKFVLPGQDLTHTATADPALLGALLVFTFFGGSSVIQDQSAGFTSTDGNTVSLATTTGKVGCLVAAQEASGLINAMGFIESLSGGGPFTAQLFEDMAALSGSGVLRASTITVYPAPITTVAPLTIQIVGQSQKQDRTYLGWVPSKITIAYESDNWVVTAEGTAYGGEVLNESGGLVPVVDTFELGPIVGRNGARWVFGSYGLDTTLDDGAVDPEGSCDIRNFEAVFAFEHNIAMCPTGNEGVGYVDVVPLPPVVTLALPITSTYQSANPGTNEGAANEHCLVDAWNNRTALSLSCYHGRRAGRVFAMNYPRLGPAARPERVVIEDREYYQAQLTTRPYTGDGASTDAGNKLERIAFA